MHRTSIAIAALLTMPLLSLEARAEIVEVTVRDANFQVVSVISSRAQLAQFDAQWSRKDKLKDAQAQFSSHAFTYKLDIASARGSERWLYDPSGKVVVLSKAVKPIYELGEPALFNTLLGIAGK
jgi:hypothetical protein